MTTFDGGGVDFVVDFPFVHVERFDMPIEAPQMIRLSDYIGGDLGTGYSESAQMESWMQDQGPCTEQPSFWHEGQSRTEVFDEGMPQISFPDFGPLFNAIYVDLPRHGHTEFDRGQLQDTLEENVLRELCNLPYFWSPTVDRLEIYTDGSMGADEGSLASWAFIVFGFLQDQKFVLSLDYGLCPIDPMEPGWYGASQSSARNGEIGAQIRVLEWLFAYAFDGETSIRYDALSVGEAAAGRDKTQLDDRPMKVLRSLSLAYSTWLDSSAVITWQHVKSHVGHFGNECVDGLAKLAYRTQTELLACSRPDYGPLHLWSKDGH